jgi:hypothetical protein
MIGFILGVVVGLVVGWNFLPQPAWAKRSVDSVRNKVDGK